MPPSMVSPRWRVVCERLPSGLGSEHTPPNKTYVEKYEDVPSTSTGRVTTVRPWAEAMKNRIRGLCTEPCGSRAARECPGKVGTASFMSSLSPPTPPPTVWISTWHAQRIREQMQRTVRETPEGEPSRGSGDVTEPRLAIFPKTAWDAASPAAELSPRKKHQQDVCQYHSR